MLHFQKPAIFSFGRELSKPFIHSLRFPSPPLVAMARDSLCDTARLPGSRSHTEPGRRRFDPLRRYGRGILHTPWITIVLCVAFAVLRVAYILHYRIDSDEPQHLHVVWGWTHGFLPYRDVFDNHAPVFQALCAPLFRLLGERADIVLWMRLAMTPFFVATLWCVKCIVSAYAGRRAGYLSAWLTALFPPFFYHSIEFRPDQMWSTLWMVVIALLVCGRMSPKRAFGTGLILGLAFAVSMKTVLMLATLGAALGGTLLITRDAEWRGKKEGALVQWTLAGFGGMLVIPLLVILYFVGVGAGPAMYYCVVQHNIIPETPTGIPSRGR